MKEVTFIRPNLAQEFTKDILTSDTLTRFAELVRTKVADGRTLEEVRRDLVEARPARQDRLDAGGSRRSSAGGTSSSPARARIPPWRSAP
jgi:hypothetical protein